MSKTKKEIDITNFPDIWKERLAFYVRRLDLEGKDFTVTKFAQSIGVGAVNSRKYISKVSIDQYRKQLHELSLVVQEKEDANTIDFIAEVDATRSIPTENKKNITKIYSALFSPEGDLAKDYKRAINTGLCITDEIVLVRVLIMRAIRLMDRQDQRLNNFDTVSTNIAHGVESDKDKSEETSDNRKFDGFNIESAALKNSEVLAGHTFASYTRDTNPKKGGIKTTYEVRDYNKVIKSLMSQLTSLIEIQYKIEYEQSLSATERRDVMRRVLNQVSRGEVTAEQAGNIMSASGIEKIPVPLELKLRAEMRNAEPPRDNTPAINREDIIDLENQLYEKSKKTRKSFLKERRSQINAIIVEQE